MSIMSIKQVTGNLVIECNVQCPNCENEIDAFDDDCEGVLYNQIFRSEENNGLDFDVYCSNCKEYFNINNVEV